jgi:hypothetical protein
VVGSESEAYFNISQFLQPDHLVVGELADDCQLMVMATVAHQFLIGQIIEAGSYVVALISRVSGAIHL